MGLHFFCMVYGMVLFMMLLVMLGLAFVMRIMIWL
jgi:hypothetical protein